MFLIKVLFWIAVFMIFWANIGYPTSIFLLDKLVKSKENITTKSIPTVTIMIVAHNEEKVIKNKLDNVLTLNYPKDKYNILITSDNSTDKTNEIVENYAKEYFNIQLYKVKERKGKTNAQNEAAKLVKSEILVMTDANSILHKECLNHLVGSFTEDVSYVTGRLVYSNTDENTTSKTENSYWDVDTRVREIESRLQTITAGNGALYAVKTVDYHDFDPLMSHDSAMPLYYALKGKRAIANHKAIAYEKAGENNEDEFNRKVRMSRIVLKFILPDIRILNFIKYKWFTYFYLGHRTSRYLLWFNHILSYLLNIVLIPAGFIYLLAFVIQTLVYLFAILNYKFNIKNKFSNLAFYYCMTILAQFIGVFKSITGKNKPFWEKAESTR